MFEEKIYEKKNEEKHQEVPGTRRCGDGCTVERRRERRGGRREAGGGRGEGGGDKVDDRGNERERPGAGEDGEETGLAAGQGQDRYRQPENVHARGRGIIVWRMSRRTEMVPNGVVSQSGPSRGGGSGHLVGLRAEMRWPRGRKEEGSNGKPRNRERAPKASFPAVTSD